MKQIELAWKTPVQTLFNVLVINRFMIALVVALGLWLSEFHVYYFAICFAVVLVFWAIEIWAILRVPQATLLQSRRLMPWLVLTDMAVGRFFQMIHQPVQSNTVTIVTEENTRPETAFDKDILQGLVAFDTVAVKSIMKPRVQISAFDVAWDFHELLDQVNKSGYSRVPIFKGTIDQIEGVLHVKDLLPYIHEPSDFRWQTLVRRVLFVPQNKKIQDLLNDFKVMRVHLAVVVDEYGGTMGVVTMEDIIEEVVGEIYDEFDSEEKLYRQLDANTYLMEGQLLLHDCCKVLHLPAHHFDALKGESESLAGLLLELNGVLPAVGEKIKLDGLIFTIVAVNKRVIKRVKVQLL